jgi:hypothetical protein
VKAFAALYRGQNSRPPCGGGPGWGVALAFPFFSAARASEVFGSTPLPDPPPQGGRELEGKA